MDTRQKRSTRLKAASKTTALRVVVLWDGGSASRDLAPGAEIVVGRSDECDLVVADDSVSRRHAIVRGGPPPTIEDLRSANGTSVGDERLDEGTRAPLLASSVAELGDALLVVRPTEASAPTPAPAEDGAALDPAMASVDRLLSVVAPTTVSVLLLGETGAGKGLIAETIHKRSARASGPFLRVNCAAFAETLLESELFGYERGAFTGAVQAKAGLLEAANGGTLLLDEVGDMPLSTQAKLLHVLEHGEVMRVGAVKPRPLNVRFVAATNRDPEAEIARGRFRRDLFFRLNGVTITVPPLRERPSEIASLAARFVREASLQLGRAPATLTPAALTLLARYEWPGNVRELRNAMTRAALFAQGPRIGVEHFQLSASAPVARSPSSGGALRSEVRELERRRVVEALASSGNNISHAAKALGIARGTLRSRMKELNVTVPTAPEAGGNRSKRSGA